MAADGSCDMEWKMILKMFYKRKDYDNNMLILFFLTVLIWQFFL